jgi:HEPN domain-containing protein
MKQPELVRLLLHKARQDEAVLAKLVGDAELDDETLGFHAQQAVEKLLKAWLAHSGVDYPKLHSLETLIELLRANGQELPEELSDLDYLTPFATVFRYEELPLATAFDRNAALEFVRKVRAVVEAQVNPLTP